MQRSRHFRRLLCAFLITSSSYLVEAAGCPVSLADTDDSIDALTDQLNEINEAAGYPVSLADTDDSIDALTDQLNEINLDEIEPQIESFEKLVALHKKYTPVLRFALKHYDPNGTKFSIDEIEKTLIQLIKTQHTNSPCAIISYYDKRLTQPHLTALYWHARIVRNKKCAAYIAHHIPEATRYTHASTNKSARRTQPSGLTPAWVKVTA